VAKVTCALAHVSLAQGGQAAPSEQGGQA